ncbi:MAG: hypothetical protein AAGA99_04415 [Actinomycetota bacterium]
MSVSLSPGQLVKISPAADAPITELSGVVSDLTPSLTVQLTQAMPEWCADGTEIQIEADDDHGRHRWAGVVDRADPSGRLVRLLDVEALGRVERRRASRAAAPFGIEWSPLAGVGSQVGIGRDLSRVGLAFVPTGDAPALGDRIVVAVQLPIGAVTAQADVVGIDDAVVRLELALVHPDSLARIVAWEAEQVRVDLAGQLSEMIRDDPDDEDVAELVDAQPS